MTNYKKQKETEVIILDKEFGKLPPQALDLEEDILGAIMLDKEAIYEITFLKPEMFYSESNKKIFKAILTLHTKQLPIDIHTVVEELKLQGVLDEIGGAYKIAMLTSRISSSSHINYHGMIVFQKWYSRELIRICTKTTMDVYQEQQDVADIKSQLDTLLISLEENEDIGTEDFISKLVKSKNILMKRQGDKQKGIKTCLRTPINALNKLMNGGFHKGDLFILAARPAMGKTLVASEFAICMAEDLEGAFFSLEMTDEQLINRMYRKNGASMYNMMNGEMTTQDWMAVDNQSNQLAKLHNITIKDDVYDLYKIGSISRKLKREGLLNWVIIDYLGLMELSERSENRNLEIGKMTRYLKKLAKQLDVPIILLSQLNRNDAGRRPILTDLRESGNIEQDADGVMFIHRPEYYNDNAVDENGLSWHNRGELIIAKYRHGRTGVALFEHDEGFTTIRDYDESTYVGRGTPDVPEVDVWDTPVNINSTFNGKPF